MREVRALALVAVSLVVAQDADDSMLRGARPEPPQDGVNEFLPADDGTVLAPPYWDLAQKASTVLTASATCGEDKTADHFCDIYFDDCDYCWAQDTNASRRHPIENVIDNTENFWMSPPLSRNTFENNYSEVNITIDLQQPFHVAYVTIKYAMSPRAKTWVLEKSLDGVTWEPWQYFAKTENACQDKFGVFTSVRLTDSTPICTQEYTDFVPAKNGEVIVSLINDRPSMNSFASSEELQEFVQARYVRIRLLEVNTLLSHLMSPQPDATAKKRYFYSIKKIEVGGRCVCNGHANRCYQSQDGEFKCECQHNTMGTNCEVCKPNFVQKKWKPGLPDNDNVCEPCNCHGHATQCKYVEEVDEKRGSMDVNGNYVGGGVCQDCLGNTYGNNCEQCKAGFWRSPEAPKTDPCQPCECNPDHSLNDGVCDSRTGQCTCEINFGGRQCDQCQKGKYYYPHCDRDIPPDFPEPRLVNNCGTCSTDLMDAVLPQTDTIKKTVVSLNHVKANKLTMTKFQYLSNMSIPIEHDRQNIVAGMNLINNYDEKMAEIEDTICGSGGLAEKHDAMVKSTDDAFQKLRDESDELQMNADNEAIRAESFVGDFEMVERMSKADYEEKMNEARDTVDKLEQIVFDNPYEPFKAKAQDEYDAAAALLENVKERFGGTQRTGRCNTARTPVDYSKHRLEAANSENFKFTPGDIESIDIEGRPITQETYYHPDYVPPEPVDNSHIFEPEEGDQTQILGKSGALEDDYKEYNDQDYEYADPSNSEYASYSSEYSDPQVDEVQSEEENYFTFSTDPHTMIGLEDGACVDQGRIPAIVPSTQRRLEAEQFLLKDENIREAYIGLRADVRVPEKAWRWEAKQWRKFNFRAPWAINNVHDGNKRCTVIARDGWRTENCETRLNQYICLGRDLSRKGKYRYFMRYSETPVNYDTAALNCAKEGLLLAVIPSAKTNQTLYKVLRRDYPEIVFNAADDKNNQNDYKAWIGLRAEGTETEVTWTWANGRELRSETFTDDMVLNFNEMAARKNKKCIIARIQYEQVFWAAESCDVERHHMCTDNPRDNDYEASLSRAKRNNNVIINNRGARPDNLEKLNEAQNSNEFNPKYSQFDELDNLVMTSPEEEYPATSSLADQLECVESIEGKSVEMSGKLNDLDHKIAKIDEDASELESKLDKMEADIAGMESGIAEINAVEGLIETAQSLNEESSELTNEAEDDMDELEEYVVADFQLDEVRAQTEGYQNFEPNFDEIALTVNDARRRAVAFRNKYKELCEAFPVACTGCVIADSGEIMCNLDDYVDHQRIIADIANKTDGATDTLENAMALHLELLSYITGGKSGSCTEPKAARAIQDFTSLENVFSELQNRLSETNLIEQLEFPALQTFDFTNIEELYAAIKEKLYGNSSIEAIDKIGTDPLVWNDIHGLEGAVNFAANPGCWREGEECNFKPDLSNNGASEEGVEQTNQWIEKYQQLTGDAVEAATKDMDTTNGGIDNIIGSINSTIKELAVEMEVAKDDKNELERTVTDIEHLIASTRSLLDRIPLERNAQNVTKDMWFEPQLPEDAKAFGQSVYSFELTVNARLRQKANNILFVGEEQNLLALDTDEEGHVVANFNAQDVAFSVKSKEPLPVGGDAWHQITFVKNARRIAVSHKCIRNCEFNVDSERGDVRKRKRRNRHSKRQTRHRRDAEDSCDGTTDQCFLPYDKAAWPIDFYKINAGFYMFIGAYHTPLDSVYQSTGINFVDNLYTSNNYNGFDGDINGIEVNRHLITPFHFKRKSDSPSSKLQVKDAITEPEQCWDNRNNAFNDEPKKEKQCPCLNGQDSYIEYKSESLDIVFRDELRGHLEFTYTSQADNYLMGAIFSDDGESYMVLLKANDEYKLFIRGRDPDSENNSKFYNATCDAYSPDQVNQINLRFGIMKLQRHESITRQAGILQWLTDYRPPAHQLHKQHLMDIDNSFWNVFWRRVKERNFYLGGIPSHYLPDRIRDLLVEYDIVETINEDRTSIKSMPACFKKMNINHDYKNDERSTEAIDGKGIYKNNKIPIRHDILYQPGTQRSTNNRGNNVIQRDFAKKLIEDSSAAELTFGLQLNKIDDSTVNIIRFASGEALQIVNKKISITANGETQSIGNAVSHEGFYMVIVGQDGTLTVVDSKNNVESLTSASSPSLTKFEIGDQTFEGIIADLRYQSEINNYDVMNGEAREQNLKSYAEDYTINSAARPEDWLVCKGWKCSGIQYNTMYSFD